MAVELRVISAIPIAGFERLLEESLTEGFGHLQRLLDDWRSGANRFDAAGGTLLGAFDDGALVAVCGLNHDPFAQKKRIGRIRRLYVAASHRGRSLGRMLVTELINRGRTNFDVLTVRTGTDGGAEFYERL